MPTKNNIAPNAELRFPVGFVNVNGYQLIWEHFEVNNPNYAGASTFKVTIPVSTLPKELSLASLINDSPITLKINAGLLKNPLSSSVTAADLPLLIIGEADEIIYQPDQTLVTISGRDYAARFIDNKVNQLNNPLTNEIQSIFSNSTSSEVVSKIAANRGLTPVVKATSKDIGNFFQPGGSGSSGYALNTSQITEWDLMVFLAKEEDYDIFVKGNKLYFQPNTEDNKYQITLTVPYYNTPNSIPYSNAMQISLSRNLKIATDVIVNVTSWNVSNKIAYTKTATLVHQGYGLPSGTTQSVPIVYNYRFPNLSETQAQAKADTLLKEISQHEMTLNVKMPADTDLTAQDVIILRNTNTLFDQTYYIKNIVREMSAQVGFVMSIEANNIPRNAHIGQA